MTSKSLITTITLIAGIILLSIVPFFIAPHEADFGGADGKAEEAITEIQPAYSPWASPFLKPPSKEIESLLFSLQASLGTGVIAYYLGYNRGKKVARQ